MDHLSKAEKRAIGRYVREIADLYGLRDWTVEVSDHEPKESDTLAEVTVTPGRHFASIGFAKRYLDESPENQREIVVHELSHIHFEGGWAVLRHDLADYLGQMAYDHSMASFGRQMEMGIDGVAHSIAAHFPLPEWPWEGTTE